MHVQTCPHLSLRYGDFDRLDRKVPAIPSPPHDATGNHSLAGRSADVMHPASIALYVSSSSWERPLLLRPSFAPTRITRLWGRRIQQKESFNDAFAGSRGDPHCHDVSVGMSIQSHAKLGCRENRIYPSTPAGKLRSAVDID